jgi:hypothetical protein
MSQDDEAISDADEDGEESMSEQESIQAKKEKPSFDTQGVTKEIRSILNKVSEGNIDPMFKLLLEVVNKYYKGAPMDFCKAYADIFV